MQQDCSVAQDCVSSMLPEVLTLLTCKPLTLDAHWNHPGSFKNMDPWTPPGDCDEFVLGCGLHLIVFNTPLR